MDVDGTLTDGKIYMSTQGEFCKAFNIKDGYGIHDIVIPNNMIPIIITGRSSEIVLNRCKELGITDVYQGVNNKEELLLSIISDVSKVAYIGDDVNDLSCMELVKKEGGLVGCPKNSAKEVLELADFIADHDGGDGAVRDFIEWVTE